MRKQQVPPLRFAPVGMTLHFASTRSHPLRVSVRMTLHLQVGITPSTGASGSKILSLQVKVVPCSMGRVALHLQGKRTHPNLRLRLLKYEGMRRNDSLTFLHGDGLIGLDVFDGVLLAAGPRNRKPHFSGWVGLPQARRLQVTHFATNSRNLSFTIRNRRMLLSTWRVSFAPIPSRLERVPSNLTRSISF